METVEQQPILRMSPQVNELFAALSKAQGEMGHAHKTSDNPFFKSKYADLAECIGAARDALAKHGLCVVQGPRLTNGYVDLEMILGHESGQWIACAVSALPKDSGPQNIGSVITYLRRYTYQAMTGMATDDDDGNAGQGLADKQPARKAAAKPPATKPLTTNKAPNDEASPYSKAMDKIIKYVGKPEEFESFRNSVLKWLDDAPDDTTADQKKTIEQALNRREDELKALPV